MSFENRMLAIMVIGELILLGLFAYWIASGKVHKIRRSQGFGLFGMATGLFVGPFSMVIHHDIQEKILLLKATLHSVPETFFQTDTYRGLVQAPYRIVGVAEPFIGERSQDVLWNSEDGASLFLPEIRSINGDYTVHSLAVTIVGEKHRLRSVPVVPDGTMLVNASTEVVRPQIDIHPAELPQITLARMHEVIPVELDVLLRYPTGSGTGTYSDAETQYLIPTRFYVVSAAERDALMKLGSAQRSSFLGIAKAGFLFFAFSAVCLAAGSAFNRGIQR